MQTVHASAEMRIVLGQGIAVRGRCVSKDGHPLPGVSIYVDGQQPKFQNVGVGFGSGPGERQQESEEKKKNVVETMLHDWVSREVN